MTTYYEQCNVSVSNNRDGEVVVKFDNSTIWTSSKLTAESVQALVTVVLQQVGCVFVNKEEG